MPRRGGRKTLSSSGDPSISKTDCLKQSNLTKNPSTSRIGPYSNEKEIRRATFERKLQGLTKQFARESEIQTQHRSSHRKGKKKKRKERRMHYKPHSGTSDKSDAALNLINRLKDIAGTNEIDLGDDLISKVEGMALLCAALYDTVNVRQAIAIILLWVKTHTSRSLYNCVSTTICELFEESQMKEEALEEFKRFEPHGNVETPEWLQLMRQVSTNWKMFVNNYAFKRISTLISILISLGLCQESSFQWSVNGIRLFSIGAYEKHASAFDFIDAVMDTLMYFVEGGYECFQQGSIKPLLYSDIRAQQFEEHYFKLLGNLEHVKTGNLEKFANMKENDFDKLLTETTDTCKDLVRVARGQWERKIFSDRLLMLHKIRSTFDSVRVQGGLRCAPYANLFYGKSGVGKSSISAISMVVGLYANGFSCSDQYLITLKEGDKFMSNYRSYINGIFIDDIGNTKSDFVEVSPTNTVIEVCNNVKMYANMAEADMKGKISVEPAFVNFTSNMKSMNAVEYSNEPVSVARRAHNTITVSVKPEFCKRSYVGAIGQQLDSTKVRRAFEKDGKLPPICDIWELTVEKVLPVVQEGLTDTISYEAVVFEGKRLVKVDIWTFLRFLIKDSKEHFKNQKVLVDSQNDLNEKIAFCTKCRCPNEICMCTDEENCEVDSVSEESDEQVTHEQEIERIHVEQVRPQERICLLETEGDPSCSCPSCRSRVQPHFGMIAGYALYQKKREYEKFFDEIRKYNTDPLEEFATDELVRRISELESSSYFSWSNWIPHDWLKTPYGKALIEYAYKDDIIANVKYHLFWIYVKMFVCFIFTFLSSFVFCMPLATLFWTIFVLHYMHCRSVAIEVSKERIYSLILNRSDAMPAVFKRHRDTTGKVVFKVLGAVAGLYLVFRIWKCMRSYEEEEKAANTDPSGNLDPKSEDDIKTRDKEMNPWVNYAVSDIPYTDEQKSTSPEELGRLCMKNSVHIMIDEGDFYSHCSGIFLRGNCLLMPQHMWYAKGTKEPRQELSTTLRRAPAICNAEGVEIHGGFCRAKLSLSTTYFIPETDFALTWAPSGGSHKDIVKYLPLEKIKSGPNLFFYKDIEGQVQHAYTTVTPGFVGHALKRFEGASYKLSVPTQSGMCMASLVSQARNTMISGFHLGGITGTCEGVMGVLLQSQTELAFGKLSEKPAVLVSASEGTLKTEQFGIKYYQGPQVHPKSPVNFMEGQTNMKVYGSIIGKVGARSSVIETMISKDVEEVTGVPQQWGPPKLWPEWRPYQDSLKYSSNPSIGVEGSLLERSVLDYQAPLISIVEKNEFIRQYVRPLTEIETVVGIDGLRFIDKMPAKTSVGYPIKKPKRDFLTLLDPEEYPECSCPVELDKMFWEEAQECIKEYLNGRRVYFIFNACTKDEPTKTSKDKVRIFQSAPLTAQLLIRMYFLPIARVLSIYPLLSECAVGVNCQGPEWAQLQQHITKYGVSRILAGDYSKYDLRMAAQLMFAAFRILINIAEASGNYTAEDLKVMRGIATDVCYPVMAYNGTLLELTGSNPSGQNLTVYINSIVNSLLFRSGFFHIYPDTKSKFREACALMTYGDDAKSSVRKGFDLFNHISLAKFLEERDMVFTMPDKTSEPTEYMMDEECDFLKRKNIYNPDVKLPFGALDESSIFKSLHATLRSKFLSKEEQAAQNIGGALREWFAHGKDVYETRRAQMKEVCERAELQVDDVDVSYEERLMRWKQQYLS